MVDCLAETVAERGCRITVRDRGAVLNLFRMLNEWYEQGLPRREDGDDEENDPWDDVEPGVWCSVATWLYEFDFYGRAGSLSSLPWRPGWIPMVPSGEFIPCAVTPMEMRPVILGKKKMWLKTN